MPLIEEYQKQFEWRDWSTALTKCPIIPGQHILDLGCAVGNLSRELASRGAVVTGVDTNGELLAVAKNQKYSNCTFVQQDLASLELDRKFDGLWCSFTAAYFINFDEVFTRWMKFLNKGAWVCISEVDDLLGHEPLTPSTRRKVESFYDEAIQAKRYDFRMGRKIEEIVKSHGFAVTTTYLADEELSFNGPASESVLQAWSNRFNRMGGLKSFLGDGFSAFQDEYLRCLASERHQSICKVVSCVGK